MKTSTSDCTVHVLPSPYKRTCSGGYTVKVVTRTEQFLMWVPGPVASKKGPGIIQAKLQALGLTEQLQMEDKS